MLGSSIYLALPRRISVVTLLFGMTAVVWILACAMLATQSLVFNTELDTRLTGARRYGIRVQEAAISKSQERLQNTLNSIRSEGSFTYCAFVGPNGIYAAHTEKRQIGKRHEEPTGTAIAWAGLTGTKFTRGGAKVLEYRLPLFLMPISPQGALVGFGFHLFGDAGDTWYEGAEATTAQMSYGLGAHFNLDTWQLRFEAARTKEGVWQFEFMDKFNF